MNSSADAVLMMCANISLPPACIVAISNDIHILISSWCCHDVEIAYVISCVMCMEVYVMICNDTKLDLCYLAKDENEYKFLNTSRKISLCLESLWCSYVAIYFHYTDT